MATANISSHQKQLEFDDNQFLSSLFGYHDKNLKVLEDKFKVKLYVRATGSSTWPCLGISYNVLVLTTEEFCATKSSAFIILVFAVFELRCFNLAEFVSSCRYLLAVSFSSFAAWRSRFVTIWPNSLITIMFTSFEVSLI